MKSLILPLMDYCDIVYAKISSSLRKRLDKLINSCVRFIHNVRKFDHISTKKQELDFLTGELRRTFNYGMMIHKVKESNKPVYLHEKFEKLKLPSHSHDTRSKNLFVMPKHSTKQFENSFTYLSRKIWNEIPEEIRNIKSSNCFKVNFREYLLKRK